MLHLITSLLVMLAVFSPTDMPAWLVGTWECRQGDQTTTETWAAAGEILNGSSRTERNGKTVFTEVLSIRRNTQGRLIYVAQPMNQVETTFTEVEAKDGLLAFENPDHDFPKRITYTLVDDQTLRAEISGNGRSMNWTFKRQTSR